jgi:hypothetical protein
MGGSSSPPPPPATQTTVQQATIPDELKPFITDILEEGQAVKDRRMSEGYVPFEGPRIAEFTPDQQEAFTGVRSLVGAGQQYFDPATRLTAASALAPTRTEEVQQYMSPYIQNVVDIQTREAQRQSDVAEQELASQAVASGGYGGSREAILQAEQQRNLQQQLGDIQAKGTAAAYEDAQRRMAEQRGRELSAGAQFSNLGVTAPGQAIKEFQGLEAVGAQKQAQQQQGLNIAQQEYEIARTFPERTLQDYSSIVRGFAAPIPASTSSTQQTTTPPPSFMQNASTLAGLGLTASQFINKAGGGLVGLAEGTRVGSSPVYGGVSNPFAVIDETGNAPALTGNASSLPAGLLQALAKQPQTDSGTFESLIASQQRLVEAKKEQLKKQREILEQQRKEMPDITTALAQGLLKYGAAPTTVSETEKLASAFSDLPAQAREMKKEQRTIELAEAGLGTEEAVAAAEAEKDILTMKIALQKANKDGILDSKDANNIYEVYNMYGKEGLLSIRPSMPRAIQLMIDNIIGAPLPSGGRTVGQAPPTAAITAQNLN